MPDIRFDTYYRYDDLTRVLHAYADEFPQLVAVSSLGKSYEGRDIWLVTITNRATGPAEEKPALWVDGNIHATEVSPSSTCLYLLDRVTSAYGQDADITRCLDTRAFYVCPRINPDGAEVALADRPRFIRSSTRPYPYDEQPIGGLVNEDIDGDGRVLFMRIADPNGPWKPHPSEPRLMVRRDPTETGGTYYRILPEGRVEDYDGMTVRTQPHKEGLDLNRNFPFEWRQDYQEPGAGPYPTSEPEIHAVVDFLARHKNLLGGVSFHTWSGVIMRPYGTKPDDEFPAEVLWTYQKIGDQGTALSGYPNISVWHDFKYHPREVITGVFDDWLYDQLGLFGWTVELWSPQRQAGIDAYKFIDWYREHPFEDDLKMLRWSDEVLDGAGHIDWYPFDHPQLGPVELGGWNMFYAWRNPPPQFLKREIAPFADWLVWHLLISPRLELVHAHATALGGDVYQVELTVQNTGWLPSYVTKKALEKKVTRALVCEIELPAGASLKSGKLREEAGQLEGRAYVGVSATPWAVRGISDTDDRARVVWVVHAPDAGTVRLTARHERAGVVRADVPLG
ncbi:MAG: carboxypeptidase [Anaerolineae bacterium]|nr:carboxypeptidase [Anaerolineae bacterium]